MGFSYCVSAFMDCTIAASRGIGKGSIPTAIVILGSCVFRVIWIYTIFAYFHTIPSLYLLYIFSWTITGCAEILYFIHSYHRVLKTVWFYSVKYKAPENLKDSVLSGFQELFHSSDSLIKFDLFPTDEVPYHLPGWWFLHSYISNLVKLTVHKLFRSLFPHFRNVLPAAFSHLP